MGDEMVMHADPHFDSAGCCDCECDACATRIDGGDSCICRDCNRRECGPHPDVEVIA